MQTKNIERATLVTAAVALVVVVLAYAAMTTPVSAQAATPTTSTRQAAASNLQGMMAGHQGGFGFQGAGSGMRGGFRSAIANQANLSVGQTITVTSTQGRYVVPGTPSQNGTASGTFTFTVTGKLAAGYTLSLTSGSMTVNGVTYNLSSGSAQMDRAANGIVGSGTTSPTGQVIYRLMAHGSFAGSSATASLDIQAGTSEYLVGLIGTIQG
ncbi:MAG: hypothetical protein LYZ70_04805 [Nitrososphaerales archaeon]|nr:hypothetical protein [Nitrososphaerales archaeon]